MLSNLGSTSISVRVEGRTNLTSHIAVQKLTALSLIGYLEAMRRHGYVEPDINYVFKPVLAVKRMRELHFDSRIIDAMYQLDEVEALAGTTDRTSLLKAADRLIESLLAFLREAIAPNDGSEAAISRLI